MTTRVRRIDGPTYGDLWRESPTAIAPDHWPPGHGLSGYFGRGSREHWPVRMCAGRVVVYRTWATMYVRPTREVA